MRDHFEEGDIVTLVYNDRTGVITGITLVHLPQFDDPSANATGDMLLFRDVEGGLFAQNPLAANFSHMILEREHD